MRRKFLVFVICSTFLLGSLLIAYGVHSKIRSNNWITTPEELTDYRYIQSNQTQLNFLEQSITSETFSQEVYISNILSVPSSTSSDSVSDNWSSGIIAYGYSLNATNQKQAYLRYFTGQSSSEENKFQIGHQDYFHTSTSETSFLLSKMGSTYTEANNHSFLYCLRNDLTLDSYFIDIFSFNGSNISLTSSESLSLSRFTNISNFLLADVNADGITEIFILGINSTISSNLIFAEYSFNETSSTFQKQQNITISATDFEFVDIEKISYPHETVFTLTGINTSSLKTELRTITREHQDSGFLVMHQPFQVESSSMSFRAYSTKLFENELFSQPGVLLVGNLFSSSETYAACLSYQYSSDGNYELLEEYSVEDSPTWAIDCLVVDLDFDNTDELLLSSYDIVEHGYSWYYGFQQGNNNPFTKQETNINDIRTSAVWFSESKQISAVLGKDGLGNQCLHFFITQQIPFVIKNNADIMDPLESESFSLESYDFSGNPIERSDFITQVSIYNQSNASKNISILPSEITFNFSQMDLSSKEAMLQITFTKNTKVIETSPIQLIFDNQPQFSLRPPPTPIVIRQE
jgi:hypothetical protein